MRRIALFLPNWIGDVVMATPAIRAVREQFPDAHLTAVSKPYVSSVLDGSPWFNETIALDKNGPSSQRFWSVVGRLKKNRYDAAVLFTNSLRTAAIAWFAGCRQRIGYARYGRSVLLTDRLYHRRDQRGCLKPTPIIDDYNRLVFRLGIKNAEYGMKLYTTPADETSADRVWRDHRLTNYREVIGVNSGGAFGAAKHWPIEHFVRLVQRFADERGSGVLVLCGPNERDLARQIVAQANRPQVVSLADREVSLGLTKACVRRLDLLVTTDSGPRHFAAAFDRPVITLFGPTFVDWTETYFAKAIHLQEKVPCGPCQQRTCPLDHRCMRDLSPDRVWRSSIELLNRNGTEVGGWRHAS